VKTHGFYQSGLGTKLICEDNYPEQIHHYLLAEKALFNLALEDHRVVTEVGCMQGRYLDVVLKKGRQYLGIDVVETYLQEGALIARQKSYDDHRYEFRQVDACCLDQAIEDAKPFAALSEDNLIIYPFNSMGNMSQIELAIDSLIKTKSPFLICTYKTSAESTLARFDYYHRCRYQQLTCGTDAMGVRFTSSEGLNSVAFDRNWITSKFLDQQVNLYPLPLSTIGVVYTNSQTIVQRTRECLL